MDWLWALWLAHAAESGVWLFWLGNEVFAYISSFVFPSNGPLKCSRSILLLLGLYSHGCFWSPGNVWMGRKSCRREASMLAFGVSFGSYVGNDESSLFTFNSLLG